MGQLLASIREYRYDSSVYRYNHMTLSVQEYDGQSKLLFYYFEFESTDIT
jgi:hypothetical protein